jgi:diadenylate cyclase
MAVVSPSAVQYVLGPGATWTDVGRSIVDVAVLGYLFFRVLLLIRGTRAIRVLAGLFLLSLAYLASQWANLVTLNWFLGSFLSYSFIFGIVVLFQTDIRRGLAYLGRGGGLLARGGDERRAQSGIIETVARAAAELSRRRRGALIVLERLGDLDELVETGVPLDAVLSPELLLAIFHAGGELHDGALVVHRGRVVAASCLLPLTTRPTARELGTRHRAALGLAEEVDAVVVVVSEERGEISLAVDGELRRGLDEDGLRQLLARLFVPSQSGRRVAPWTRFGRVRRGGSKPAAGDGVGP